MADLISGKKVCAVRLEGTITTKTDLPFDLGEPKPGAIDRLKQLQREGWYLVIITGLTRTSHGTKQAFMYISQHGIPYDEVFASYGLPAAERWIDDRAEPLLPKV